MNRNVAIEGRPPRGGFTWKELLAVIVVSVVVLALLLPAVNSPREASRRVQCMNNLKQIGLGIHNYTQANRVFPPGTICSTDPIQPGNQYDVWAEAGKSEPGFHGTSFLLSIMPYLTGNSEPTDWSYNEGISSNTKRQSWPNNSNFQAANLVGIYCPTRRSDFRPEDTAMMLSSAWTGGGTDYGGCAGRHAAFTLETGYNLCDASMFYEPNYFPEPFKDADDDAPEKRWGVFGRVNVSTKPSEITDGMSNTILTGELQRITDIAPGSKDGWAIGGPATLFTTGALFRYNEKTQVLEPVADPEKGKPMNNRFFGSPGSEHAGGAHFGLADGSVYFQSEAIDPRVFALLGSMTDKAVGMSPDSPY